jgi:hypothetical protein
MKKLVAVMIASLALTGIAFGYNKNLTTTTTLSGCLEQAGTNHDVCIKPCNGRDVLTCAGACWDSYLDDFKYCADRFGNK